MTMTRLITLEQINQYKRFVEEAADKALVEVGLDKNELQKLINNGDEFQARIIADIREISKSNHFVNEEMESSYGYPLDYRIKDITKQINILHQFFPDIGLADEKIVEQPLPANAEGWFAIPKWQLVAETYNEAVQKVLDLIKKQRKGKFHNWRENKLEEEYLRQHEHTVKKLEMLAEQQKGYDILVVAAQSGIKHRGRSVRRVREVFMTNEFGLGAFEIGCILLVYPERLQHCYDLWIDCAGNEYAFDAVDDFSCVPCFGFYSGKVRFETSCLDYASIYRGSASGFLL